MGIVQFLARAGLFLCLTVLPFLFGNAVLRILDRNGSQKFHMADAVLTGWIVGIGAAEAVHLAALFLKRSFSEAVFLFEIVYGVLALASLGIVICGRRRGGAGKKERAEQNVKGNVRVGEGQSAEQGEKTEQDQSAEQGEKTEQDRNMEKCRDGRRMLVWGIFVLLVIWQVATIQTSGKVYRTGDMTVETVESFLETDGFYEVNPLTGNAYGEGMPSRLKILCLPTLYGALCKIFGLSGVEVVWKIVPLVTLLGSYLAFSVLAGCLFPEESDRDKRSIFMLFVAALFCVGDYLYGMDGFGLLYSGFRGVVIRNAVLLPYTLASVLRRRWKPAVLCVLAEACIVWTLYGMGACLLAAVIMYASSRIVSVIRRGNAGEDGKLAVSGTEAESGRGRESSDTDTGNIEEAEVMAQTDERGGVTGWNG